MSTKALNTAMGRLAAALADHSPGRKDRVNVAAYRVLKAYFRREAAAAARGAAKREARRRGRLALAGCHKGLAGPAMCQDCGLPHRSGVAEGGFAV